ncbi:hypothetical protein QJQ45_019920, partial [Haematococcus lacustris]
VLQGPRTGPGRRLRPPPLAPPASPDPPALQPAQPWPLPPLLALTPLEAERAAGAIPREAPGLQEQCPPPGANCLQELSALLGGWLGNEEELAAARVRAPQLSGLTALLLLDSPPSCLAAPGALDSSLGGVQRSTQAELEASLGGAELVLSQLASVLVQPQGSQAAAAAFAAFDTDGSGHLEPGEQVRALRAIDPEILDEEVRLLLAYLSCAADSDHDGRLSAEELRRALAVWVPGPPAAALQQVQAQYLSGQLNAFEAVQQAVDMQPGLLHSLFLQLSAPPAPAAGSCTAAPGFEGGEASGPGSGEAGCSGATASAGQQPRVPLTRIASLVALLLPAPPQASLPAALPPSSPALPSGLGTPPGQGGQGVEGERGGGGPLGLLSAADVQLLLSLVVLEGGAGPGPKPDQAVDWQRFSSGLQAGRDAVKRAAALHRMVEEAGGEGGEGGEGGRAGGRRALQLDPELGGSEVALQRLAAALVTAPPHQVAAAFAGLDLDGSGALDPAELSAGLQKARLSPKPCCAWAELQVLVPGVQLPELRLLVAYALLYGDSGQRDGRLSLAELTVLLEPFTS